MYRQYEDPIMLESALDEAKKRYADFLRLHGASMRFGNPSADALMYQALDLKEEVDSLEERVNFAWQDTEYDALNCTPVMEEEENYYENAA